MMGSRIGRWAQSAWNGIRTRRRIEALGPAAAADMGLSLSDLAEAASQPGDVPDRMARMAAALGACEALARADRYRLQDMARTCAACVERGFCDQALHRPGGTLPEDLGFCPNMRLYREMAQDGDRSG